MLTALALIATGALHTADAAPPTLYDLDLTALDGSRFDATQLEDKAVLFVNVASKCGYTPQYEGLQRLHEEKKDEGLVIIGVPSNQFGGQEPGSAKEIASFCRINYGVTFPILEKQDVNGPGRSALYTWLVGSQVGAGKDVGWNFEKFLVSPKGEVVQRFSSGVRPESAELNRAIDGQLPK